MFNFTHVLNATTKERFYIDKATLANNEGYDSTPNGANLFEVDLQPEDPDGSVIIGLDLIVCNNGYSVSITKNLDTNNRYIQQGPNCVHCNTVDAFENVDYVTEKLMSTLYEQSQCVKKGGLQSIRHGMSDWYTSIFKTRPDRVETGFHDLDIVLRGMFAGNLVLLAARPAVGKTAFGVQIARHVAGTGKAVNIYSCEMEKGEILERLAANESNVNMDDIIDNDSLKDKQHLVDAIAQAADKLMKLPINISDDASITVAQIRAQCRMTKNLGLIVVDYIQLLKSSHRSESRNVEVGEISRSLKLLANDLKVPVLALSQLSRDIEKRVGVNKEPQMSDLRDSGSLEQDANKILFVYPVQDDVDHKVIAVKVAKNRRGHVGEVQFSFDGSHMRHNPLVRDDYVKPHVSNRKENPFAGR